MSVYIYGEIFFRGPLENICPYFVRRNGQYHIICAIFLIILILGIYTDTHNRNMYNIVILSAYDSWLSSDNCYKVGYKLHFYLSYREITNNDVFFVFSV